MRVAGYIRVSSAEQVENWSLDAQQRAIADLCHSKGWELVGFYREEGASAWAESSERRPPSACWPTPTSAPWMWWSCTRWIAGAVTSGSPLRHSGSCPIVA